MRVLSKTVQHSPALNLVTGPTPPSSLGPSFDKTCVNSFRPRSCQNVLPVSTFELCCGNQSGNDSWTQTPVGHPSSCSGGAVGRTVVCVTRDVETSVIGGRGQLSIECFFSFFSFFLFFSVLCIVPDCFMPRLETLSLLWTSLNFVPLSSLHLAITRPLTGFFVKPRAQIKGMASIYRVHGLRNAGLKRSNCQFPCGK